MGEVAAHWLQPLFAAVMNAALAIAVGVAVLRPVLMPTAPSAATAHRFVAISRWACWLLGMALVAYWCSSTIAMTDSQPGDLPASLWLVLTRSHFGAMLWLAFAAWILLTITTIVASIPLRNKLFLFGLIGFTLARASTGHAAEQGFFSFSTLIHTAHILAATAWVGSVLVSVLLSGDWNLWQLRQRSALAHRLSEVATWSLVIVVGSGLFNTVRTLANVSNIWASDYTWILMAKLGAVAIASGLGLRNRWHWLNLLDCGQPFGASGFRRVLVAELVVLLIVLGCAAKLGTTMPTP